jgi:hypothetical protein
LALAVTAFLTVRDVDITPYKPTWLLKRDLAGTGPAAGKALAELTARMAAPKSSLSEDDVAEISGQCLAKQANRAITWDPAWGRFIEGAHAANRLPAEKWATYAKQAIDVSLVVRPTVRQGDPVPLGLTAHTARVSGAQFVALFDWTDIRIDGNPAAKPMRNASGIHGHNGSMEMRGNGAGMTYYTPLVEGKHSAALGAGEHDLSLKLPLAVYDASAVGSGDRQSALPAQSELATMTLDLRASFTVFDADHAPRIVVMDESLRPKVEAAVKVNAVTLQREGKRVFVDFSLVEPPMRVAFHVTLRPPRGGEIDIGDGEAPAGQNHGYATSGKWDVGDAERVDVVFHPNVQAAIRSTDASPIWGGEVIVKNVPVKVAPPSSQP